MLQLRLIIEIQEVDQFFHDSFFNELHYYIILYSLLVLFEIDDIPDANDPLKDCQVVCGTYHRDIVIKVIFAIFQLVKST